MMHRGSLPSLLALVAGLLASAAIAQTGDPAWTGTDSLTPDVVWEITSWPEPRLPPSDPVLPPHVRDDLSDASVDAVGGLNDLGFRLLQRASESDPRANRMISPLSITTALGMAYAGAEGETARQMEGVLGFDAGTHAGLGDLMADLNTAREGRELNVVNRVFAERSLPFKAGYLARMSGDYGAPLEPLDFRFAPEPSRLRINDWVADQTNNLIKDLLPAGSVKSITRAVLTNAIYFNGDWKHRFEESATADRPFHLADGSMQLAPTMRQTENLRYGDFDGYQMLQLPYSGDDLSMVIALPEEADGLDAFVAGYSAEQLEADVAALGYRLVDVALPKFSFESEDKLKNTLVDEGLSEPFSGGADFTGMAWGSFAIDEVYHKAFIDVSETGTEAAAAATAITIVRTDAITPPPTPFVADRPFLFAIRDNHSGAVMFLGRIGDPQAAAATVPEPATAAMAISLILAVRPLTSRHET